MKNAWKRKFFLLYDDKLFYYNSETGIGAEPGRFKRLIISICLFTHRAEICQSFIIYLNLRQWSY